MMPLALALLWLELQSFDGFHRPLIRYNFARSVACVGVDADPLTRPPRKLF